MGVREERREIVLTGPLFLEQRGTYDWPAVFGTAGPVPVLIDIGAARARFFLNVGPKVPHLHMVGMEVAKKRVERALELLEAAGLGPRARMSCGNALVTLRDHVPEESVAAFTVLFPDPWPKKGHAARRIFAQDATVDLLARRLVPGGLVLLKSDAKSYFDAQVEAFSRSALLEESEDLTARPRGLPSFSLDWPDETRYESEWKKEGRAIYAAAFRRRDVPLPPRDPAAEALVEGAWRAPPKSGKRKSSEER